MKKVLVTPDYAQKLLKNNSHNRRVNEVTLNRYFRDIIDGKWKEDTGECIKISKTNAILDGQHRLLAVIKANKPVYFHILEGLEDDIFDVLDTGKVRSSTDAFKIKGIKNETIIPPTIQKFMALNRNKVKLDSRSEGLTNAEIITIYEERPAFWQNVAKKSMIWYSNFAKILNPSTIGGFYAYFHDISAKDADDFMTYLSTGTNIQNNTINLLRNKLMNDKLAVKKITKDSKFAVIIKCWNAYRKNEVLKVLKWDPEKEKFPKAI